jgi:hypothetical protein
MTLLSLVIALKTPLSGAFTAFDANSCPTGLNASRQTYPSGVSRPSDGVLKVIAKFCKVYLNGL